MKSALHFYNPSKKLSMNMGELIPIGVFEALPGDVIDHSVATLIRTQPLLAPVMHEVDAKIHHWFVPTRDLWDDFPDFITGGPNGTDNTTAPYITLNTTSGALGTLADYLGCPTIASGTLAVSALPFRAYARIWNEYYRDQDLQTELVVSTGNGSDTTTNTALQYACWEKDYFTSARASPQKGPAVSIPLAGNAPVYGTGKSLGLTDGTQNWSLRNLSGGVQATTTAYNINVGAASGSTNPTNNSLGVGVVQSPGISGLQADLSSVSGIDMEDLRLAASLQRYQENLSRYGSRFVERIMAAYGVRPRSLELDLPLYIGGGQQKISISEVLATAEGTNTDVGDMKGHGITAMRSNRYRYPVPEFGYIITMLIIRPRTNYIQGLPKLWSRETKEDYYQPELAYLGQQPILNKELYAAHASPDGVFGYQDAYDSYRYIESTVAGEMRDTLDFWHMARKFSSEPALNADFVKSNPTNRIYAIPAADQLYVMAKHKIRAKRRVIKVAKPQLF